MKCVQWAGPWVVAIALGSVPSGAAASVDPAAATPTLKRIEQLFGWITLGQQRMVWPVAGPYRISSRFGMRRHPLHSKHTFHYGLDIAARAGTPIVSVAVGHVVFAGWQAGYGRVIEVEHEQGLISRYAHARSISVKKGQLVLAGQMLGSVGQSGHATGAHLHLELERAGRRIDPLAYWADVNVATPR